MRITHKPSGIVVSMQDEKSQLQNREKALRVLRARLYERALAEQQAELAADRRSQVGTGDRAEKIRTYNYGERRVTDHRIKLTVHNLDQVLEGELDELTAALQADEKRRRPGRRRRRREGHVRRADALDGAITAIAAAGCETPRLDAELLLADVLGVSRERLLRRPRPASSKGRPCAPSRTPCAAARCEREPVAYILGRRGFRRLELAVDPRALIPRPETELLVEVGLGLPRGRARARRGHRQRRGRARAQGRAPGPARDRQRPQRGRARARARQRRAARPGGRSGCSADLLEGVPDEFDAILSNPPYVAESERASLAPEILRHEPPAALFAGPDGLDAIRALLAQVARARAGADWWRWRSAPGRPAAVAELIARGGLSPRCAPSATWRGSSAWSWAER